MCLALWFRQLRSPSDSSTGWADSPLIVNRLTLCYSWEQHKLFEDRFVPSCSHTVPSTAHTGTEINKNRRLAATKATNAVQNTTSCRPRLEVYQKSALIGQSGAQGVWSNSHCTWEGFAFYLQSDSSFTWWLALQRELQSKDLLDRAFKQQFILTRGWQASCLFRNVVLQQ